MTSVSDKAREAAAMFVFSHDNDPAMKARSSELGDALPIVQAFARFEAETLERAAKVADDNRTDDGRLWDMAADTIATAIRQLKGSGDE